MPRRILVIEDEEGMRQRLTSLVRQIDDVEVDEAGTEQAADELIDGRHYNVALVDLQLNSKPNGKLIGLKFVSALSMTECKTIIVTGDTREAIGEMGAALSCDILTKPFMDAVLVGTVERALQWQDRAASDACTMPPDLTIDPLSHSCRWRGSTIHLTPTELSIVHEIWTAQGRRVDLNRLTVLLKSGAKHAVTQHITNIRRKFEDVDPEFNKIHCIGGAYFWER